MLSLVDGEFSRANTDKSPRAITADLPRQLRFCFILAPLSASPSKRSISSYDDKKLSHETCERKVCVCMERNLAFNSSFKGRWGLPHQKPILISFQGLGGHSGTFYHQHYCHILMVRLQRPNAQIFGQINSG